MRLATAAVATGVAYEALVRGALTLDLGVGRQVRSLGPRAWQVPGSRERVYELLSAPYAERRSRAMQEKVEIWERGSDMVLAAHRTRIGRRTVVAVEVVRFEPPHRISFRLVRGPVPHLAEAFELANDGDTTTVTWSGELGTDLGRLGAAWGGRVAAAWTDAVDGSLRAVVATASR